MKASIFNFSFLASCAVICSLPAMSQPVSPTVEDDTGWSYDFGADLRIRQEMMDNLGSADRSGDSKYKGWLTAARYDFPILLSPKGASGIDRFEIFAHIVAESFLPGDYYDSSKPAYFIRWEVSFKF